MGVCNYPLVSVVIPCYNHEAFVQKAIQSVIAQTYENIEMIVIDDGSSDSTDEKIINVLNDCKNRFVRFEYRSRENKGLSATLNEALTWCKGDFVASIASDDYMLPEKTEIQVRYIINKKKCAGVFGGALLVNDNGSLLAKKITSHSSYTFKDIFLNRYSLFSGSQLIRLSVLQEIGGYKEGVLLEDWYIFLKITYAGFTLDNIPLPLIGYRRHSSNISNNYQLMHVERRKILSLYTSSPLYQRAILEYNYTVALEMLPYEKIESLKKIFSVLLKRPTSLFRISTGKYAVKVFISKNRLLGRKQGLN